MKSSKESMRSKEVASILTNMVDLLSNICDSNNEDAENNPIMLKPFISKNPPDISIENYLKRLYNYTKIEPTTLVLVLVYIDLLCERTKIRLNYHNIHKLILASLIVAVKYNEDGFFMNSFYAQVGGVTKSEVDKLEYEFLSLMEFRVFVDDEIFNKYYVYLETING